MQSFFDVIAITSNNSHCSIQLPSLEPSLMSSLPYSSVTTINTTLSPLLQFRHQHPWKTGQHSQPSSNHHLLPSPRVLAVGSSTFSVFMSKQKRLVDVYRESFRRIFENLGVT
ncbi:uncharacterized protein LOC111879569 [Lactuca sativa]|uniref:Uncharacterized protein n=1 Tax=Lactuca sativa TaxID=4236 RepID=A0A9R1X1B6_LACSA|nr:uncharacterized protein LOC111879569 [Lactuca sativa]KAJ0194634.1 hypothetical protein LSAT_V11C700363340 [Lactuca sativa]